MHSFNHMLDVIISHGIDLTDIDIVPQSDVTDHFLVSCMLHITDIKLYGSELSSRQNYYSKPLKTDSQITCRIYLNCSVCP